MKKSLFYGFIAMLMVIVCIVTGTTYAMYSNEKVIKSNVDINGLNLDLKLEKLVIKEGGNVKTNEILDCGFDVSIDDNGVFSMLNMVKMPLSSNGLDITFDIVVKNNSNTDLKYFIKYEYIEGLNYAETFKFFIDDFFNQNGIQYNNPVIYKIKANEKKISKFKISTLNESSEMKNFIKYCPNLKLKFSTYATTVKEDIPEIPYIGNLLDDYYGIHKVDFTDNQINYFNFCENSPIFMVSHNGLPYKLEKINENEDSFIKIEKIENPNYTEYDNLLNFKVSLKNLAFSSDLTSLHIDTLLPYYNSKDNQLHTNFNTINLTSNSDYIKFDKDKSMQSIDKHDCISQIAKYDRNKFLSCKDEYKELFTAFYYFY